MGDSPTTSHDLTFKSRIYIFLNSMFGEPAKVQRENYTRTETIFQNQTMPLLEFGSQYLSAADRVLIIGCGSGVEIDWFANNVSSVVAVDINPTAVLRSQQRVESLGNVECRNVGERSLPFENEAFDVLFMHNVCEHIIYLNECFQEYRRVLKPGGVIINSFAPLFYSPYGGHFQDALKMPWGHLIFGPHSVAQVRNVYYPGVLEAATWADMGLNCLTERRYRKLVQGCSFVDEYYDVRTSMGVPLVHKIPILRNLFISSVTHVMRKQ